MPSIITSGAMNAKALGFGGRVEGADVGDAVNYSVRFNSADTPLLSKAFVTPTSVNIYTLSVWLKRSALSTTQRFFGASTNHSIGFNTSDQLVLTINGTSYTSTDVFRDVAKPYNFVYTQSGTTYTIYVGDPNQSVGYRTVMTGTSVANTAFNTNAVTHQIGAANSASYLDGYLADVCFVDGVAQLPTAFGRKSADTGAWVHKNPSGLTYGTNGFRLQFNTGASAADLGTDTSGNGNTFTVSNLSVTAGAGNDWLADTPTNTYATLNPLAKVTGFSTTFTNGALDMASAGNPSHAVGTMACFSGCYWEATAVSLDAVRAYVGIVNSKSDLAAAYLDTSSAQYSANGDKYVNGAFSVSGTSYTNGDVVCFAYKNGKIYMRKNGGSWENSGDPVAETNPIASGYGAESMLPYFGYNSSWTANFGQRAFAYTPPTGYLSLCTANLPTPAIANGTKYVKTLTYSGSGASNAVTGAGHQPDVVSVKSRASTTKQHFFDSVRGTTKGLVGDETAPYTDANTLTAFGTDGFTMGSDASNRGVNISGATYVAECFKMGTLPGMNIVSYTGDGNSGRTVAHGLGVTPHAWSVHRVDGTAADWWHYHKDQNATPQNYYQRWSTTTTTLTSASATAWNNTAPDATNVTLGNSANVNANGVAYIMYVWVGVDGFSRFGRYTGNGAADGPFVWTGFEPEFYWIHNVSANYYHMWYPSVTKAYNGGYSVFDPTLALFTQENTTSTYAIDNLSGGFKARASDTGLNESGSTFVYWAWGRRPFKFSNAR